MNTSSTSSPLNTNAALGKSAVHAAGEYGKAAGPLNTDAALGKSAPLKLSLDPEQLASCTACGMCLPHCPTYRVTGEEAASPRGRLALMSAVQKSGVAEPSFAAHMELCVLCRGCETACPAGVPFGHLMEQTREALTEQSVKTKHFRQPRKFFQRKTENKSSKHQQKHPRSSSPLWLHFGYKLLPHRRLLRSAVAMGAVAQRLRLAPKKLNLPAIPLRQGKLRPSGDPSRESSSLGSIIGSGKSDISEDDTSRSSPSSNSNVGESDTSSGNTSSDKGTVWLFTGCIMDAAMRDVHHASQKVIEAAGTKVSFPGNKANCCGSLHRHAGLAKDAAKLAHRTIAAFPGNAPILVNSAGCGAVLKDYGNILGTEEARQFSSRVKDIHEWLAGQPAESPLAIAKSPSAPTANSDTTTASDIVAPQPVEEPITTPASHSSTEASKPCVAKPKVAILDPCHLRHAQGVHNSVRDALQPFAEIAELDDQGMCCGAGGAYSFTHPELAAAIRNRKIEAIQRSGATQVAAANPGCILHLQKPLQALGIDIIHPVEIIRDHLQR